MRITRIGFWFPCLVTLLALGVAPLWGQETSEEQKQKSSDVTAEVVDGKLIITSGQGNVRVIQLHQDGQQDEHRDVHRKVIVHEHSDEHADGEHHADGDHAIWIQESAETGKEGQTRIEARAILVGPDGKQKEVVLNGIGDGEFSYRLVPGDSSHSGALLQVTPELHGAELLVQLSALSGEGFMIGVSCQPAGDTLRAQLGIEQGLVVEDVVDDSPAAGNIEIHDILLQVGDEPLNDVEQLIQAVQEAGKNESELRLGIMRSGKKMKVSLTPQKREATEVGEWLNSGDFNKFVFKGDLELGDGVMLESFGPGLIEMTPETSSGSEDLQKQIENLRQELEQLRSRLENRK